MGFYPGLFQYFSSWKYPVSLGGNALCGLHEFSLQPVMLELSWVELCQVCRLPGRKLQCCQKCWLVLHGCLGISSQRELLGLCGLWQSSGLQMFMSRSCICSHIQNHEWLSWYLCRPGPGEVLFFGLALNLMNISFYSGTKWAAVLQHCCSAWIHSTGEGETLRVQLLPFHSALAVSLPL